MLDQVGGDIGEIQLDIQRLLDGRCASHAGVGSVPPVTRSHPLYGGPVVQDQITEGVGAGGAAAGQPRLPIRLAEGQAERLSIPKM